MLRQRSFTLLLVALVALEFLIVDVSGAPSGRNVNEKDIKGKTALHRAAETGNVKEAQKLIDQGAEVNIESNLKVTPLHYAANNGHKNVAELLIRKGAIVDSEDDFHATPLHSAALKAIM
ncbi:uncharacterized protein LOC129572031 [Sitodiplosis mosellana]|uniref:uncharacterized protein LOC129572031 n=1 Tax=Sitodiplosis mosellana TaxID=263140 RepID=UPI002444F067|nr:uncharacterized protein LOC129572031 [Sitodiplosis mosellana]